MNRKEIGSSSCFLSDGVIIIDPEYLVAGRLIAVQLVSLLRYGREDDEVMGVNMSKELCLASIIINRVPMPRRLTRLQVLFLYYPEIKMVFNVSIQTSIKGKYAENPRR